MSGTATYINRRQAHELLTEHGFPIAWDTFNGLCQPCRQKGPPEAGRWGKRALYEPATVLAWAQERLIGTKNQAA
jgi:hypothetical protein